MDLSCDVELIDVVLPSDVLAIIFTFLSADGILSARAVSQYWSKVVSYAYEKEILEKSVRLALFFIMDAAVSNSHLTIFMPNESPDGDSPVTGCTFLQRLLFSSSSRDMKSLMSSLLQLYRSLGDENDELNELENTYACLRIQASRRMQCVRRRLHEYVNSQDCDVVIGELCWRRSEYLRNLRCMLRFIERDLELFEKHRVRTRHFVWLFASGGDDEELGEEEARRIRRLEKDRILMNCHFGELQSLVRHARSSSLSPSPSISNANAEGVEIIIGVSDDDSDDDAEVPAAASSSARDPRNKHIPTDPLSSNYPFADIGPEVLRVDKARRTLKEALAKFQRRIDELRMSTRGLDEFSSEDEHFLIQEIEDHLVLPDVERTRPSLSRNLRVGIWIGLAIVVAMTLSVAYGILLASGILYS